MCDSTSRPVQQPRLALPPTEPKREPQEPVRRREPPGRTLTFSPAAWLKLMFFLHAGETEVGGFALTDGHDPLSVEEFVTVRQRVSAVSVEFDDDSVADHFDACVDAGLTPERFARVWVHTHPGDSPSPSFTDEHTFARVFGGCDWALMFIVSRTGRTYARLGLRAGPGAEVPLGVAVDWGAWPQRVLEDEGRWDRRLLEWAEEYERNVHPNAPVQMTLAFDEADAAAAGAGGWGLGGYGDDVSRYGGDRCGNYRPAAERRAAEDEAADAAADAAAGALFDAWLEAAAAPLRLPLFGGNRAEGEVPA